MKKLGSGGKKIADPDAVAVPPTEAELQAAADRKLIHDVRDHTLVLFRMNDELKQLATIASRLTERVSALEEVAESTSKKITGMRQTITVPHIIDDDAI